METLTDDVKKCMLNVQRLSKDPECLKNIDMRMKLAQAILDDLYRMLRKLEDAKDILASTQKKLKESESSIENVKMSII
jgi:hypothetical protein